MSVTRHVAAYTADTCHSEVVLSSLCEFGQSLQSLSQEYCFRKGIHVYRKLMQKEIKFLYQAFIIKEILHKHNVSLPVTKQTHKHFGLWSVAYRKVGNLNQFTRWLCKIPLS